VYYTERIAVTDLAGLYERMLGESILQEFAGCEEITFYCCGECDLRFFYHTITGSESFYERLQEFGWYYMDEKEEYDFAARYVNKSDRVLEVGSGKGAFARRIRARDYVGLEFSRKAALMAKEDGAYVINESVREHALNNVERYDVVCSFQVLEHVSDPKGFLKSSIACIKPGGVLIVSVPSADSFLSSVTNGVLNLPPHHVTWWTDRSLKSLSDILGLEIVELHHDALSAMHKDWYFATVISVALNKLLMRRPGLIDMSLAGRLISKLAWILGKVCGLAVGKIMRPRGHSVTAIFRKSLASEG
jgi:2-polyprenyl-3-methyl-5-hydroxy-6-metoxy-1,4-benzoquinol methylase